MNARKAIESLVASWGENLSDVAKGNIENIWSRFNSGDYAVVDGTAPAPYDEADSSICWGWLMAGDATKPMVATFARGERGNEEYDESVSGLVIWLQVDAAKENAKMERAAKALVNKRIGFSEFKRIMRENS
jgi:hypothetical protein